MIEVQIVDDHRMIVESLSRLINETAIARVSKVYYDLAACREGLVNGLPGILLLDIGLPDGDGVSFCAEIRKRYPGLKIIMLTSYKEFSIAKRALHHGARGYILKNAESEEMLAGIETVSRGELFLCDEIDILLKEKENDDIVWLSDRESQILKYVADGYTTKEIADLIFREPDTVKFFRKNLLIKLNARNVAELIKKAYGMKLI
ncbi:MAG: response regulator transcription factor [Bacteroidales bacterium]|jgi:DNA-binding NarL/FixJ family response regulator|nr:response regulator transcription factor [Bacteroidales bacterium]